MVLYVYNIVHIFSFFSIVSLFYARTFIRISFFENDIIDAFNRSSSRIASVSGNALGRTSDLANGVVTLFQQSGRFAFRVQRDVDDFFNDIEIRSIRDTWVTRVSEGVDISKGMSYVNNKRNQPNRYPEQFVDDLEGLVSDLMQANLRKDFFEYKEVGFHRNELHGYVGVIAVRRYAFKQEFDIAFSITSTDVVLEYKNCVRSYFWAGNCNVDTSNRLVRTKLVKYFQKELILELKNDYPGKIEVIWADKVEEDT